MVYLRSESRERYVCVVPVCAVASLRKKGQEQYAEWVISHSGVGRNLRGLQKRESANP